MNFFSPFSFPLSHSQEAFSLSCFSNRNPRVLQTKMFFSLKTTELLVKCPSPAHTSLLTASHWGIRGSREGLGCKAQPYRAVSRAIMRLEPVTHPRCAWVASLTRQHHIFLPRDTVRDTTGTYPPEEPASAQHPLAHWGRICRAPRCQDLGSSQREGSVLSPKSSLQSKGSR